MSEHRMDCDWHFDQYPWECTCGATYRQQRDTIEAQAAEIAEYRRHHCTVVEITRPLLDALETQATAIKRLREALRGMVEYSRFNESWQEAHPEYVEAARAALGETE